LLYSPRLLIPPLFNVNHALLGLEPNYSQGNWREYVPSTCIHPCFITEVIHVCHVLTVLRVALQDVSPKSNPISLIVTTTLTSFDLCS
jgi:hypothetical protein